VYFRDKGPQHFSGAALSKKLPEYLKTLEYITPRALERRAKVLPPDAIIGIGDLPLHQPYLNQVRSAGAVLQRQSRWLNATSVIATADQLATIAQFPFVLRVAPVVILRRKNRDDQHSFQFQTLDKAATLDYGPSALQMQMINVPPLHDLGITGHNVIVGMLDTGFRWRAHESLQSRNVIAEHDFIQNDDTTANQVGDSFSQDQHGTLTMSALGGYKPGRLIGPAFDACFVLAKTEYLPSETMIEEDNWAEALEWMEGLGVEVASSSLGYNDFDPLGPNPGDYTWANGDFDGRTSVTALACVRAARLGMLICNAMGNEGNGDGTTGTMLTPADADSIISVGAINYSYQIAGFSSTGPTNDGRTKPDVVAPGVGVYCASTSGFSSYFNISGTSLATPLTGGAATLLLSARPELTPFQVRDALRNTASPIIDSVFYPSNPNNFTGWGLIDAFRAALFFGPIFSNNPTVSIVDSSHDVTISVASKDGINPNSVIFHYAIGNSSSFDSIPMMLDSSMFFATSGRYKVVVPSQAIGTLVRFYISAEDSVSLTYQSPPSITNKLWQLNYGTTEVDMSPMVPQGYALMQNYPNPFNPMTKISFDLPRREHVRIQVFSVLGELIATLVDDVVNAGSAMSRAPIIFDGAGLPSGVYFYRVSTPSFTSTKKMMLIR